MRYWYDHSGGLNLTVGGLEYLEPPGIVGYIVLDFFA